MSVELIKDLLNIDQTIGKEQIQALVEGEITLPAEKPKINKILYIDGIPEVTDTKIVKDKIVVSGIVKFKVLYSADDEKQSVHSIDASTDFSEEMEINDINEQMLGEVRAGIEHIDYRAEDETVISVKAVVLLEGKVQATNNIDIVNDIRGPKGLQVRKENIKYNNVIGTNNSITIAKEAFEISDHLPNIVDVLRVDAKAYERETKVVEDKVIVAGIIEASIMYFGDDEENKINYLRHELPFTHFIGISGALKDMNCSIRIEAGNPTYEVNEDINGDMRIIDVESVVKISAKVYEQLEKEVTVDTYSVNKKFDVKRQEVNISENIGCNTSKEEVSGVIDVSDEKEIIKNIYNINAKPILTDYRIIEGKVIIEGLVDVNMLYLEEDSNEIKDSRQDIPFKSYVDIEGIEEGMECEVELVLDDTRFNKLNSREVEVNVVVRNEVSVNRIKKINIITELEEFEEDIDKNNMASIVVYIVQLGDTLWDIAKRYNTTVEDLISTNDIMNPDNIMPGEKIIIEKTVEFVI